jgi:hypothetical protein
VPSQAFTIVASDNPIVKDEDACVGWVRDACRLRSLFANVEPKTKVPPPPSCMTITDKRLPLIATKLVFLNYGVAARVDLFRRTTVSSQYSYVHVPYQVRVLVKVQDSRAELVELVIRQVWKSHCLSPVATALLHTSQIYQNKQITNMNIGPPQSLSEQSMPIDFSAAGEKMEKEFLEIQGVEKEIYDVMSAAESRMKETSPRSIKSNRYHTDSYIATAKGKTTNSTSNPTNGSSQKNVSDDSSTGTSSTQSKLSHYGDELATVLGIMKSSTKNGSYSFSFGGDNPSGKKKQPEGKARRTWFWTSGTKSKHEPFSDNDSVTEDSSTGTASTLEFHEQDEELSTILNHIELAKKQRSFRYQFGDGVPGSSHKSKKQWHEDKTPSAPLKEFKQRPEADYHLAVQEEALNRAMTKKYQSR